MTAETGSVRERVARALREAVDTFEVADYVQADLAEVQAAFTDYQATRVLAAVADDPGLVEVLRGHTRAYRSDWGWICVCQQRFLKDGSDAHAAHLADVIRAWLRGES